MADRLTTILADPAQRARLERRFWAKVNKDGPVPDHRPDLGPCWLWTAATNRKKAGYGKIGVGNREVLAHRVSFALSLGEPLDGFRVLHHCDNSLCVNPEHLFQGTQRDNMADMWAKGRQQDYSNVPRGDEHPARRMPWRLARGDDHPWRKRPELVSRGERHYNARITEETALAIKRDPRRQCEIARAYGLRKSTVQAIKSGRTWKHLP